ncbi:MAG: hypothetical protein ACOH2J_20455 [Allorhizobium sp.]
MTELLEALKHTPFFYEDGAIFEQKTNLGLVKIFDGTEREIRNFLLNWWVINASLDDFEKSTVFALAEARDYQTRTVWQAVIIDELTERLASTERAYDALDARHDALKAQNRVLTQGIADAVKILLPEGAAHVR